MSDLPKFESREALAQKIGWEGGLDMAMDYGITTEMLPEGDTELLEAWTPMQEAWDAYAEAAVKVRALLPEDFEG